MTNAAMGLFVSLEGGEAVGKSSQAERLAAQFRELGHAVTLTREPGGSPGAEAVRHVLLSGAAEPFGAELEAILFAAARADHVTQIIQPALENGDVVITDRFIDSTRVYQGVTGKVSGELLRRLEVIACGPVFPDITIVLDLNPHIAAERALGRRAGAAADRFEKEKPKLHITRREAFLKIAEREPKRCMVIDAAGTQETIAKAIWRSVRDHPAFTRLAGERENLSEIGQKAHR